MYADSKLIVKLKIDKPTQTSRSVENLNFKLREHQTKSTFKVIDLGIFDGILGMDWLGQNSAIIKYRTCQLKFKTLLDDNTTIKAQRGEPKL